MLKMLNELNKKQWVFVAFLALMTAASIVAGFAGGHGTHETPETKAVQSDAHDTHDAHAEPVAGEPHKTPDAHAAAGSHGGAHWWASVPLFWILFGAIGCAVLILFGKKVIGPVIYKKEDYYNE